MMSDKEMIQVASVPMECKLCSKFMGDISIKVKDDNDALIRGSVLREFLINSGSFPTCDVCCTTETVFSKRVGRNNE